MRYDLFETQFAFRSVLVSALPEYLRVVCYLIELK